MAAAAPSSAPVNFASAKWHQGVLWKRGKVNKSGKERWFVLTNSFKLLYYESQAKAEETFIVKNDRNVLGVIDLLQVEKVEVSRLKQTDKAALPKYIRVADDKAHSVSVFNDDDHDDKDKDSERAFLMELALLKSPRTYRLSAVSSAALLSWLSPLSLCLFGGVLFESFLLKKGEVNKAMKRRYFVLTRFKQLRYYNDERRSALHGVIDLDEPSMRFNFAEGNVIELVTQKRKWTLSAKDDDELFREWAGWLRY